MPLFAVRFSLSFQLSAVSFQPGRRSTAINNPVRLFDRAVELFLAYFLRPFERRFGEIGDQRIALRRWA
jgi:hypothetical protein